MFVCGLLAVICIVGGGGAGGSGGVIGLGLLFGALALWFWRRSKIVEYQLFLMTSSSEAQAISSRDPAMIDTLRDRIESAMAGKLLT
jgi:MYXO-CTERM domain-containing protein